jgi:predicted ribosome quality control (RQC) complex YloA/Tae2 family protein
MKSIDIYIEENGKSYQLLIGQNKNENDRLLKTSSQTDLWFHLDKQSSPHMILKANGEHLTNIPKRYINYIGSLFREYKNNLGSKYHVIYTEMKNVKLTNEPGLVILVNSKLKRILF